jgi:GNAT superfamily N-acetyltransferase
MTPALSREIAIRPYRPDDADAFRRLNEQWIARFFAIEEPDRCVLNDPQSYVLDPGGHIFMAELDGQAVGCCALIPHAPGEFEVGKMAVAEDLRGLGIGRKVLEHIVAEARGLGAKSLYLETNSMLENAIHLYESVGFQHVPSQDVVPSPYARSNVAMRLLL